MSTKANMRTGYLFGRQKRAALPIGRTAKLVLDASVKWLSHCHSTASTLKLFMCYKYNFNFYYDSNMTGIGFILGIYHHGRPRAELF